MDPRSLPGLMLAALLLMGAAAPEVPAPAPAPVADPRTSEEVLASLNRALAWYRQARIAMRSVTDAEGQLFAREDEQLALHLVQRAFDVARAEAALVPAEAARRPEAGEQASDQKARLQVAIRQDQEEVARFRAQLRTAPAARKADLQRAAAAATNRLELDRARLDFLTQLDKSDAALSGAEPDTAHQIQALQDAMPDLNAKDASRETVAPVPAEGASGTWSVVRRLLALRRSRASLEDLTAATNALARDIDENLRAVRAAVGPLARRLQELTKDPSGGSASLADGDREFHQLLERGKRLSAIMVPLRQESALVHRYADDLQGWERALDRQVRQLLQAFAIDFVRVLVALAVILAAAVIWGIAVGRYVTDAYRQRLLLTARNTVVMAAIALVLIFHFTSELATLVTALGFAAAGIAFALQNIILSMAGYFSIVAPNGIRVGDRVSLQGPFGYVHGEVIEIGFVRMRLRELTGEPLRPSGRIVVFPNSVVFTGSFFKLPSARAAA